METTGKTIALEYQGRGLKLCNQRCRAWTHDYSYQGNGSTLSVAGCGIFSIVNASCWLTGVFQEPDELAQISKEGYGGILCIETGGPTPGLGCAGRGIIATFQLLEDMELFEHYKPDVVLYDVLGDVVCGGFAAPIREGYANKVLIVTSGEKMALYAANNISSAVRNFEDRSYARVFGIVLNHRNVENEKEKVQAFSEKIGVPIVGEVPRSNEIIHWEEQGKTVIEGDPASEISRCFFDLATLLWKEEENA